MKKSKYGFSLLLIVLTIALLATGCRDTQTAPQTTGTTPIEVVVTEPTEAPTYKYTVTVQNSAGGAVENAIVALYDGNGVQVGDYGVTNVAGKAFFENCPEDSGYSVEVIAVPVSYQLLAERVSFPKDSQSVSVALEQDYSGYVCKIEETPYFTLSEAITAANEATENVTIELTGNAYVTSCRVENTLGKDITIDGNGYHIITSGADNSFDIHQTGGTVHFKNVTVFHNGINALIRTRNAIGLNLTDVEIYATENVEGAFKFYLFNISGSGTSYVNMTRVKAEVRNSHTADKKAGLIRTGVDSTVKKTVYLTMTDCNIDLTRAVGRSAIMIMGKTTAKIQLNQTKIVTSNAYAIRPNGQSLTISGGTIRANASAYQAEPIEGCNAKIGNSYYSLDKALEIANEATENVTVQLIGDIAVNKTLNFTGENDTNIVLDGSGHTITTTGGNHDFVVKKTAGSVTLQNLNVEHQATRLVLRADTDITVNMTNVLVSATGESNKDGLIRLLGNGTLNLTGVDLKMKHEAAAPVDTATAESDEGVIRAEGKKTVSITLTDCNIDLTGAPNRTGIVIGNNVAANMELTNTVIATADHYAIRPNGQKLNMTGCTLSSLDDGYNANPIEGYVAKIGEKLYTLEEAFAIANAAAGDVTIQLTGDVSVNKTLNILGENTNAIVLDGGGHTITTTGGNHDFVVKKTAGSVTLQNLNVDHQATRLMLRVDTDITVNLVDMNVIATGESNKDGLIRLLGNTTLEMTGVNITMTHENAAPVDTATAESDEGVIRAEGKKTVSISLTDCTVDLTGAPGRTGIVIGNNVTAAISLTNTAIATKDHYAIRPNGQALEIVGGVLSSLDEAYNRNCIEGCVAKVNDIWYSSFSAAAAAADDSTEAVTVTLYADVSACTTVTLDGSNDITIDGNGYTYHSYATDTQNNHVFVVKKTEGTTLIQNLHIDHQAKKYVIRIDTAVTVSLTDVSIVANNTATDAYKESLIRFHNWDSGATLNLTRVSMTLQAASTGNTDSSQCFSGAITTGDNSSSKKKTVNINLVDTNIDVTGASGRAGICVSFGVTANISMVNSAVASNNEYAILARQNNAKTVNAAVNLETDAASSLTAIDSAYLNEDLNGLSAGGRGTVNYSVPEGENDETI